MSWVSTLVEKRENNPKNAKKQHLLKTTRILNIKMSAKGGAVFTFSLPGGGSPQCPPSVTPLNLSRKRDFDYCTSQTNALSSDR